MQTSQTQEKKKKTQQKANKIKTPEDLQTEVTWTLLTSVVFTQKNFIFCLVNIIRSVFPYIHKVTG